MNGEPYKTVAEYDLGLENDGFDNYVVLGRYDSSMTDQCALRSIIREMTLKFNAGVVTVQHGDGVQFLLTKPENEAALLYMNRLNEIIESEGQLCETDWCDLIQEEATAAWLDMDLDERIETCQSYGDDISLALKNEPSPGMCQQIEEMAM